MVRRRFIAALLAITFAVTPHIIYAEPTFSVEVHPDNGTMDDAFIYSVVLEDGDDDTGAPLLTGGNDFTLSLIGPQTSLQIINGVVSRKAVYNYQLIPKHEGTLNTPGAEISIGGKKLTAAPLSVTVKGARATTQPTESKDYFMRQSVETPEHVYVGQQIPHTLEILTRVQILDPQLADFTFPDFRNEAVGEQETTRRYVNGEPYTASTFRRALYPLKAGALEIPARDLKAKVKARSRGRGPFPFGSMDPFDQDFVDDFFGQGKYTGITIRSNPLQVQVEPLPHPPAHLPLMGLDTPPVGPTTVKVSYDNSDLAFGDTKTITLTVNSSGIIQALKGSGLQSNAQMKVYEESPVTTSTIQGNKIWTTKTIKLSIVPLSGSSVTLPPFALGYFDPISGSYQEAKSEPIRFNVIGAPTPAPLVTTAPGKTTAAKPSQTEQATAASSAPISSTLAYQEPGVMEQLSRMISLPLALLLASGVIAALAALWIGFKVRARFAPRRALLDGIKSATSLDGLAAVVRLGITRAFPALGQHFTREELRHNIVDKDLLYSIEATLDHFDSALFGGGTINIEEARAAALSLLKKL